MSVINTNIKALVAQDSMVKVNRSLSTAMERLSTGSRINTAADDAAGLSITTRMDSQVRGLSQAIRNANDGISIVQTTEGALEEVTSMLQRMRELSVQSVNASNNADDRAALEAEVVQLKTEIDRVASTTQWNNMNVLDGSFKNKVLQIGDKANQTMKIDVASVKTEDLGTGSTSISAKTIISARVDFDAGGAIVTDASSDDDDIPAGAILINNTALRAFTGNADDLSDIVTDINAKVTGVTASAFNTVVAEQVGSGVLNAGAFTFTVRPLSTANAVGGTIPAATTFAISQSRSLNELVANINKEAGGLVQASLSAEGKLQLSNDTGATIAITVAGANSGFTATGTFQGFLKLESTTGDAITVTKGNLASATAASLNNSNTLAKIGLRETVKIDSRDGNTIRGSTITTPTTAWASGDLKINGVNIHDPLIATTTFQGKLDTINRFSSETGVTATAYTSVVYSYTNADNIVSGERIKINGINTGVFGGAGVTDLVTAVNLISGQTGVKATAHANNIVFEGNVASINLAMQAAGGILVGTGKLIQATPALTGETTQGGLQLDSADNRPISIQLASASDLNARLNTSGNTRDIAAATAFGLLEQNVGAADFDVNAASVGPLSALAISKVSVATSDLATKAIGSIDKAIAQVSAQRSELGAVENRLEKTVNNLSNIVTNTAQSRSRIKDTDYAVETTNLAKAQIIQQAATAMLAQANQQPQSVLALLQ